MKDISRNVRDVIERYGWYVVHIHHDVLHPCPRCMQYGEGKEANPRCPVCLGFGARVQVRPIKVRNTSAARPNYNELEETDIGILGNQDQLYYCLPEAEICEGDYLVEVTWNVPTERVALRGQVLIAHKAYEANRVEPKHGDHGELSYYRTSVHAIDLDTTWLLHVLTHRPVA